MLEFYKFAYCGVLVLSFAADNSHISSATGNIEERSMLPWLLPVTDRHLRYRSG